MSAVEIWIEDRKLSTDNLKLMDKKAKKLQPSTNIRRIPYKIATGEEFSGYTTNQ